MYGGVCLETDIVVMVGPRVVAGEGNAKVFGNIHIIDLINHQLMESQMS